MRADLETFFWFVQPGAYSTGVNEVGQETPDETPDRIPSIFANMRQGAHPSPLRRYAPLREQTGLFRLFAKTESTEQSILRFADRFGLLLSARQTLKERQGSRGSRSGQEVVNVLEYHHEPLALWYEEASALRKAVEVWELLEAGDSNLLAPHVCWRDDDAGPCSVEFVAYPDRSLFTSPPPAGLLLRERIAARGDGKGWFERLSPGDAILPAWLWLTQLINDKLQGGLTAHFVLSGASKTSLEAVPKDLLRAIWLQFSQAVSAHKQYRRCSICQDWFELSPQVARTNRRFCGVVCKNRAYRGRREQACQLFAQGKKPQEIARLMDTTPSTIKRWISEDK